MNGYSFVEGVLNDEGDCVPKPFAVGWEVERIHKGVQTKQMMWYLYCLAKPIEDNDEQSQKDIKVSNDTINCVALKKEQFKYRGFTLVDTKETEITTEMQTNFFKKVQTTDTITAPTL